MADPDIERLRSGLFGEVPGMQALGVEADPGSGRQTFVAKVSEEEADRVAAAAERMGFPNITFESAGAGQEILRISR